MGFINQIKLTLLNLLATSPNRHEDKTQTQREDKILLTGCTGRTEQKQ